MNRYNKNKNNNNKRNGFKIQKQGLIEDIDKQFMGILKPIDKAVESIGEITSALGFNMLDNPTIGQRSEMTRITSQDNLNTPIGVRRTMPLVVDPKGTAVTPAGAHKDERIGSLTDLMGIPIAMPSAQVTDVVNLWKTSFPAGSIMYLQPVGPLFELWEKDNQVLTPSSAIGANYDLWRGSYTFEVTLWHTPFNKGSIGIAFWNYQAGQSNVVDLTSMSHCNLASVNLAGNETKLSVTVPYKHQLERSKVYDGSEFDLCFTGSIVVWSITTLQTKEGFPDEVPFVVRISSKDLEFSNHSASKIIDIDGHPTATDRMKFVRSNYANPMRRMVAPVVRQGDEGTTEIAKDVYHEAGFGKAVEDVIKPVSRMRKTTRDASHAGANTAQTHWDVRKIYEQAHVLDSFLIALPSTTGPIAFFQLPQDVLLEENCNPCIKRSFRFYNFDNIRFSITTNTMNGVAGAGFMVFLRGVSNQVDAETMFTGATLQQIVDMNGGVVFSLASDREIHLDCPNVYPLNNFSVDVADTMGVLVVGLYTDTILGTGQTGSLDFTVKASLQGYDVREPNYNPSTQVQKIVRQGDHEVAQPSSDDHQTDTVELEVGEISDQVHLSPYQEKVRLLPKRIANHTDSIMSFEQLKRYQRVMNIPITSWTEGVFEIYPLLQRHALIMMILRMVRFVHFGVRFKIRILPNLTNQNLCYTATFRGSFGQPDDTSLNIIKETYGSSTVTTIGASGRAALVEMNQNTVGEMLDFEIPYTSPTKTIVVNGDSNGGNHLGYDFGSVIIASNEIINGGYLQIYIALSDDCSFSCPVGLVRATKVPAYPNSFPAALLKNFRNKENNTDSESEIEVIEAPLLKPAKREVVGSKIRRPI